MTPRKLAFVQAYLANGGNATQAAIAAGYSARSAGNQGGRMMKDDEIRAALASAKGKAVEKAELTAEEIVAGWARIIRFDPAKLCNEDGTPKTLAQIDEDTRLALAVVQVEAETDKHGRLHKYTQFSKPEVLRDAARWKGLFKADNAQVAQSFAALVRAAAQKRRTEKR